MPPSRAKSCSPRCDARPVCSKVENAANSRLTSVIVVAADSGDDLGLCVEQVLSSTEPVEVKQRIVTNYFTAKRMLQALHLSVQRHEQAFGVLETDVQKRVIGGARPARSPS